MAKDKTNSRWHSKYNILFNRAAPKRCMAGFSCKPAARCHSISVSRILRRIADDGNVIAVIPADEQASATLGTQGINQVSTFSGFCAKHDQELFALIDNFDYKPHNLEQEFLFAYRTVARYHYYKLAWRYAQEAHFATYKDVQSDGKKLKSVELNRQLTDDEVDELVKFYEQAAADAISNSESIRDLMGMLNSAIAHKEFALISTRVVMFPDQYPIAQSGSMIIDNIAGERGLHMITVNVIPQQGQTYALLSCTGNHGTTCIDGHLERFRTGKKVNYRAAITHIMCMAGDPIAINPTYWKVIPDDLKEAFIKRLNVWMKGGVDPVQTDGSFNILQDTYTHSDA